MELVEVACPVCGSTAFSLEIPDTLGSNLPVFGYKWTPDVSKSYRFVRCQNCEHVYASPRLRDMYRHYVDTIDETYVDNALLRTATARRLLKHIKRICPEGRLIDIGCATGDFLSVAREYYEVEGLELSSWARAEAQRKALKVRPELIADMQEREEFDIVTLWGVIEHLESPLEEMKRINRVLKPGGIVCLWTGDVDSYLARLFGRKWWYVMGQHMQLFSRSSLKRLMEASGFDLVHRANYPYVLSVAYFAKRLGHYPVLGPLFRIFDRPSFHNLTFSLSLPTEIFDVYRKVDVPRV